MKTLQELSLQTDKNFVHNTIHVYQSLFEPIRNSVQNVLEIGINTGLSHRMWRDYFHNASIYGLDIDNFCDGMQGEERISVDFCDAYSLDAIKSFGDIHFDIIIDDGPHTLESQKFTAANYISLLNVNGIMVIEDIPNPEWIKELTEALPFYMRDYSYAIDRRYAAPNSWFHDEILFVIDKRFI
jgi:hypothetical protein